MENLIEKIEKWAEDKNLLENDRKLAQLGKLLEESGELASAILKDNIELQKDSIGDCVVVLIILSKQLGLSFQSCVELAYEEIKDRKGKLSKEGSFIKDI